jgi:hypothetical protein
MARAAALAVSNNRIQRAIDARVKWLRKKPAQRGPEPRLWDFSDTFSDDDVYAVLALSQKEAKDGSFDFRQYTRKLDETTPVLAWPRLNNKALDLWRMLSQPEICEGLWPSWKARTGQRGSDL